MLTFKIIDPRYTQEDLGFIPCFLTESNPRDAVTQIDEGYQHGGGWRDLKVGDKGFRVVGADKLLFFPGDPPLHRIAEATLHGEEATFGNLPIELIYFYESAFIAVIQSDGSFRVARID